MPTKGYRTIEERDQLLRVAKLDDVQPGTLTVIYGDESVTLDTRLPYAEYEERKRKIDVLLLRMRTDRAQREAGRL